jgi:hypothetical protein
MSPRTRRTGARAIRLLLTPDEHAPAAARRALRCLPLGARRDDVLLLTSELVTSAVEGGAAAVGEPIEVAAECDGAGARVEVCNRGPGRTGQPAGHGLRILEAMTDHWGVAVGGRSVWFELSR